jgi:HEAT repeat protein
MASNDEKVRLNLANAIGQTGYQQAEPALLGLLNENPSEAMQKVILNALGNAGTKESLKALRSAAENAGYAYRKDNATASYIFLLGRLNNTEPKLVKKEAEKLLATGKKLDKQDIRIAAAKLLLAHPSAKKEDILKSAIKDGDITYLSGVLNLYPFHDDNKSTGLIQKELAATKSPEVQTALIYWSGNHNKKTSIPQITRLANPSAGMVQKAAILSLAKLGGEESLIALASLLKSDNDETVALAKNALSTYNGDISYTLASVFEDSDDTGKTAILELIASRKMESQYNLVYNQMFSDNGTVKAAAANSLKDVSTDKNLPDLFTLLEREDAAYIPAIQQAINAALSYLPAEKQLPLVTERMKNSPKKHLYYTALANSESRQAMDIITNAYATATGAEKEAAFDALTHWKSFHVIYPLLDIARNSKDKRELEKVTDALISVIRNSGQTGAIRYLYLRKTMQFAQTDKQKNDILRLIGNTGQYQAMLFVAPYMDEPSLKETAALAAMNIAINEPSFAGTETTQILNKVGKTLSNPDADYQRQSIAKYLAENPTEGGFVSLFNGKNLDGWKGLVENPIKRAKMSQRELAAAQAKADKEAANDWKVENGNIVFDGTGYNNLCTEKQYGDFEMLIDWKLYPGPEPDAGIYLRGTPQVQIWDTARTNVEAEVGSGGLYNNQQNPSKPLKVADQKVGEWNTFLLRMIGDVYRFG